MKTLSVSFGLVMRRSLLAMLVVAVVAIALLAVVVGATLIVTRLTWRRFLPRSYDRVAGWCSDAWQRFRLRRSIPQDQFDETQRRKNGLAARRLADARTTAARTKSTLD